MFADDREVCALTVLLHTIDMAQLSPKIATITRVFMTPPSRTERVV